MSDRSLANQNILFHRILDLEKNVFHFINFIEAKDLLSGMFALDPEKRLTLKEVSKRTW